MKTRNKTLLALLILFMAGLKMYPQTKAESIAKNGCLAMCYLYCMGIDDDVELIKLVASAIDRGLLDSDCFVLDADKLLGWITGRKFNVIKKNIAELGGLENITELTPVRFDYNGFYHWVVVQNGKIIFDSLANSVCVKKGKPTTARVIIKKAA